MSQGFNSTNPNFTNTFTGHVRDFVQKYSLFDKNDDLLITVSGGIDSIALCHFIFRLQSYGYSNRVRVLHIHHNTRKGQTFEQNLVANFAKKLGFKFSSIKLGGLGPKNFEFQARTKRYEEFYSHADPDEKILLGHHINDSFEWSLMQSLKSSSLKATLGIPVINNKVIRPFMSVTKKQIANYAKCFGLPYREDPTNDLLKFETKFSSK